MLDKRVTIRLDDERFTLLEKLAQLQGCSVSFVIRHLVIRFLERERREFPSTPAALAGAMESRQSGPVVPVPATTGCCND